MKALPISEVPELRLHHPPSLRLAPNERLPLPPALRQLIDHPAFQRLRGVRQLGFVDRLYPSATHTRFEHSLGVLLNSIRYVHSLWEDQYDSFFRDSVSPSQLRALFVAALCHDIGQYPGSHVLEDTERTAEGALADSVFDHERFTHRLFTDTQFRLRVAPHSGDLSELIDGLGTSTAEVFAVLSGKPCAGMDADLCSVLHSIIDGPIDADKLDYLQRDAHHAGVDFGRAIDVHRFLQSLTIAPPSVLATGDRRQIALTSKGIVPAEQLLMARYHMFREVYWHRTVRAHEAVFAAAVQRLRAVAENFETWFQGHALSPGTTDDWLLELILNAAKDKDALKWRRPKSAETKRELASCIELLTSLRWSAGRRCFKRLLGVSATDDLHLYILLQGIRDATVRSGKGELDQLSVLFAGALQTELGVGIDPALLIVDVPPIRAAANTAYIVGVDSPRRQRSDTLAALLPWWGAFTATFGEQTRRVRVFTTFDARERIRSASKNKETVVYQLFRDVALEVAQKVSERQYELL